MSIRIEIASFFGYILWIEIQLDKKHDQLIDIIKGNILRECFE